MAPLRRLLLIADTGPGLGWGHLSRMVALGQAWRRINGLASLLAAEIPDWVKRHCEKSGIQWQETDAIRNPLPVSSNLETLFISLQPDAICLDGYRFDDSFELMAKNCCRFLVSFDDFGHAAHEYPDLIVNPNVYATTDRYPQIRGKLMCGRRYVVLREEFLQTCEDPQLSATFSQQSDQGIIPFRILVSLGGAATSRNWRLILQGLAQANLPHGSQIDLLMGGTQASRGPIAKDSLSELADPHTQTNFTLRGIKLVGQDSSQNVPQLFRQANLAIAASGSSLNELAFLGVPTVAFATAENQVAVGQAYDRLGAAVFLKSRIDQVMTASEFVRTNLTRVDETNSQLTDSNFVEELALRVQILTDDFEMRREMAQRGMKLIDGLGATRIAERLELGALKLRPINSEDWQNLLDLRNEELVRLNSFSPDPVPETVHRTWLAKKLEDPCAKIWAIEGANSKFLGQSRLDWQSTSQQATVGIAVCAEARGIGVAETALLLLEAEARRLGLEHLEAIIKPDNGVSRNLFSRAGYKNAQPRLGLPPDCTRMVLCLN